MKAGISTACLYPALLEDVVRLFSENGVKRTEIFFNSHSETEPEYTRELEKTLRSGGVSVDSAHPFTCGIEPMMFFTHYERRFKDIVDYYRRFFEVMERWDAKIFVFHGNKPQNVFPEELYFDRFQRLSEAGREYGVTVAQEIVARCESGNKDFLARMSEALGDKAAFVLDTKQVIRSGEDIFDILELLGGKIKHVHFSDSSAFGDCLPFGRGNFDKDRFFSRLKDFGFDGTVMLELYRSGYKDERELLKNYREMEEYLEGF